MGADAEAVVDSEARMQSVRRIRIVDASIMPRVITGNLNAPVMMMAEKISDRIRGKPLRRTIKQFIEQSGVSWPAGRAAPVLPASTVRSMFAGLVRGLTR